MGRKKGKKIEIRINSEAIIKILQPIGINKTKFFTGYDENVEVSGEWVETFVTPSVYKELKERTISSYLDKDGNWIKEPIKFFEVDEAQEEEPEPKKEYETEE